MAVLAIRVTVVHDELDPIVRLELPVARETARGATRWEERVTAFGAEEVLFVVCTFTELFVFQSDVVGVGDGGLAVVATGSEVLCVVITCISSELPPTHYQEDTDLVVVQGTIRPPLILTRRKVNQ